jgi:Nucleotidyltransferase domain
MEEIGLPDAARGACDRYLAALDEALPGFAEGVYLTGSAALGDWIADTSDLDVLVVSARPAGQKELDQLRAVHQERSQPFIDTVYVTREQVGMRPTPGFAGVPCATDGEFNPTGTYELNPVLWATLARHGITVRGPQAALLSTEPDPDWLRAWNLGNLTNYWTPLAAQLREGLATRAPGSAVKTQMAVWCAGGPGRLHKTIATGRIISKTECIRYTADLFPDHKEWLARAAAARLGNAPAQFTTEDGWRMADLIDAVAQDAARL